jgi:nucleoside-diphosphate-sugar epimerase
VSSYQGVRVLVTGASGFIGRHVAKMLVAKGALVMIVARDKKRLDPELAGKTKVLVHDLTNAGGFAAAIATGRPSIVFNLAGYGVAKVERDDVTAHRVNMLAVGEALEAIAMIAGDAWEGARIVQAGSALEYGAIEEPLDENAQPLPTTTYGQTKLAATTIIQHARDEVRFPGVTARLFTVFGPGEREGRLFPTLAAAAKTTGRIPLSEGSQSRDWVYVEDAAKALLDLGLVPAERLVSGLHPFDAPAINLASGNLTTVREFAIAAAKALGIAQDRLGFGDLPPLPEEMHHGPVPIARLQAALGWIPPCEPADGLARAAAQSR